VTHEVKTADNRESKADVLRAAPWIRVGIAVLLGLGAFAVLPQRFGGTLRALLGWDTGVLVFFVLIVLMFLRSTHETMRQRAAIQDLGRTVMLFALIAGTLFSIAALVFIQKSLKGAIGGQPGILLALIGGTILLSWVLAHTVFTLHYAHAYYGPAADEDDADGLVGGLEFPSEGHPDYWDFMYFSFVVGMTCQVSDVQISDRGIRRLALFHGVVSFFFNTIILALTINVIAGVI
jgi:uncharacterized membrane protein